MIKLIIEYRNKYLLTNYKQRKILSDKYNMNTSIHVDSYVVPRSRLIQEYVTIIMFPEIVPNINVDKCRITRHRDT